jgi:hypothetical protein
MKMAAKGPLQFRHGQINAYTSISLCEIIVCINLNQLYINQNIVTYLINALPSNSTVNTVQQATIDEAVFSM